MALRNNLRTFFKHHIDIAAITAAASRSPHGQRNRIRFRELMLLFLPIHNTAGNPQNGAFRIHDFIDIVNNGFSQIGQNTFCRVGITGHAATTANTLRHNPMRTAAQGNRRGQGRFTRVSLILHLVTSARCDFAGVRNRYIAAMVPGPPIAAHRNFGRQFAADTLATSISCHTTTTTNALRDQGRRARTQGT